MTYILLPFATLCAWCPFDICVVPRSGDFKQVAVLHDLDHHKCDVILLRYTAAEFANCI